MNKKKKIKNKKKLFIEVIRFLKTNLSKQNFKRILNSDFN